MAQTWVLVADSSRARIFTTSNSAAPLQEQETLAHPEGRLHEQSLTSDLPGKDSNRTGSGHHAMDAETEPKRQEAIDFAKRIAKHLDQARSKKEISRLIIVAAPSFLGILRDQLSKPTAKLIAWELDKNLVQQNPDDIRAHMPQYLPKLSV